MWWWYWCQQELQRRHQERRGQTARGPRCCALELFGVDLGESRGERQRSVQCLFRKWQRCRSDYRFKTVRFSERHERKRTDTEVGEDGMDAGERVMSREFLLGDPREADEGVG